jgi:hypothetical protein
MDINNDTNILKDQVENFKELTQSSQKIDEILEYKRQFEDPTADEKIEKLIDCPHEIIFTINAKVLAQNEKGELIDTREICIKNYHIPVPIDKDYKNYMGIFFKYLEDQIIDAVDYSNQNSQDKKEN